jgi:hypothetical protein
LVNKFEISTEKFFWDESFRLRAEDRVINLPFRRSGARQTFLDSEGLMCDEMEIKEVAGTTVYNQIYPSKGWVDFYHWLFVD